MRVSVIGCGNISRCHLAALSAMENLTISSVVDIDPARAETAAAAYGCPWYTDYLTMLDDARPDAVHLCTPHHLHVSMAVEALRRGIHVLCEKPCAIHADELKVLRAAQTASAAQFGVCFQNRYNPGTILAKQLLTSQAYGALKAATAQVFWCRSAAYYNDHWHGKWATEGGGVLVNQAIHTEDLLRYLIGADLESATAHTFNDHLQDIIEVEDTATVQMRFENGVSALLNATTAFSLDAKVILDFYCENGLLRLEGADLYAVAPDGAIERLTQPAAQAAVGKTYWGNGHPALITDFYRCIRAGEPFPIDAFEGGKATEDFLRFYGRM